MLGEISGQNLDLDVVFDLDPDHSSRSKHF
jgi:hypothetical protein